MTNWIDISTPLSESLPVWPGDPPFKLTRVAAMTRGEGYNLSAIAMTCHAGTHIDAPRHFFNDGATTEDIPLDALIGPARVIEAPRTLEPSDIDSFNIGRGERILFKTGGNMSCLSPEAARRLATLGVQLVGVDALSIGYPEVAEIHRALLGAGVVILEVLDLSAVAPGDYDLICLPLKIVGVEGAPARAVVRERSQ